MKQRLLGFILFAAGLFSPWAQETKPLIKFNPLFIEGISAEESRFIESLIQSYLSDIGEVIAYLDSGPLDETPAAALNPPPDYTISGSIHLDRDGRVFLLEIVNTHTGQAFSMTSVYKSAGELALKTRSVLESAFSSGEKEAEQMAPEQINENLVVGSWKGEAGIEVIRLQRGGRGVAVFSSGAQMVLAYTIEGNTLKVSQISPNSERFYYPLPLNVARRLAAEAEPMSWELSLYRKGTVLEGVKLSTAVRIEEGEALEFLAGGDVREVTWTKAGH
jgi:hypothetical protein